MASVFSPGRFEQLHRILTDAIASPARVAQSNEWYIALDRSRADLADLARAKGPNEAEKKEIQSGKVTIEGVAHDLNADFAQQSLALAQHLEVSERYAASLLQAGMQARAKWGRSALEVACILYHRERLAAFACLKELIGGASVLSLEDESEDGRNLAAKMQQLVDALLAGPQALTLTNKILKEIDTTKAKIEQVYQAVRGLSQGNLASTQQVQPLGDEIQIQRLRMMRKERQDLAHVLYLLSSAQLLNTDSVLAISEWLAARRASEQDDSILIYVVVVILNVLTMSAKDDDRAGIQHLMDDQVFVKRFHADLTTKKWESQEVRNLVLLQWSLSLTDAAQRSPGLVSELRMQQDSIQKLFLEAVHGDAFYFIVLRVLAFRQRQLDALEGEEHDSPEAAAAISRVNSDVNTSLEGAEDEKIDPDFQEYILEQVQSTILTLNATMLPSLRKLQRSEEDAAFAASRSASHEAPARRYDIEALFDSVALLCRARPDSGLAFWLGAEGRGNRFLNWAIEVREPGHQRALFEMLASLSAGKESAWHAQSLLSFGDVNFSASQLGSSTSGHSLTQQGRFVSWIKLFDWVQQSIETYKSPVQAAHPVTNPTVTMMSPNEAILLRGFFKLLRNVAFYSIAAREALYQHSSFQVIPRLFAFYSCPIIIEVKASILDALAAFAHPSGGNASKITSQLWSILENTLGLQSIANNQRPRAPQASLSLAIRDMQTIEVPARIFPVTTSLVNFLKTLIHIPAPISQRSVDALTGSVETTPFSGLALNLGQGYRTPGLEPYVNYVIDDVLLQASSREYSDPAERWRVTSACLEFVERCVTSYDIGVLLANGGESADPSLLAALVLHPGFEVMKRILTGTKLLQEILHTISPNAGVQGAPAGFEIINSSGASTLFFVSSVRHSLLIVQRVLQIQDLFLQVLLPTLNDAGSQIAGIDVATKVGHAPLYAPLDSLLLHAHQSVVQMALCINCVRTDVALLSVRIVALLASSPAFSGVDKFGGMGYNRKMNRLVGLLEMSDEADRIRAGFVDRLEAEAEESASDPEAHVRATLALLRIAGGDGQEDEDNELQRLVKPATDADEAIRMAILDLLIAKTAYQCDAPNVAHLLLGFDLRATRPEEQVISDADAYDSTPAALHTILELLRPKSDGKVMSLSERSPAFAEKCHRLVNNLCRHPYTSHATLRYLRTKENFFAKQLRRLTVTPVKRDTTDCGALGTLIQRDGGHTTTTVDALVASLQIRALILSGAALELHTLCTAQNWGQAARLVSVLIGRDSITDDIDADAALDEDDDDDEDIDSSINGRQHYDQHGILLLEILTSLDFEWHDARDEKENEPTVLRTLDISQAQSSQSNREFDVRATLNLLAAARSELERRGDLADGKRRAEFDHDAALILEHISSRNGRRVISIARRSAIVAWRNTLDMIFMRANHLIDASGRATLILDCLAALLPRLSGATSETDPALSDVAAGAVLSLLTRLRQHQSQISPDDTSALADLPIDRLVATLQALTTAISQPGTTMQSRGNMYSALINFLQLINKTAQDHSEHLDSSFIDDDGASTLGGAPSEIDDSASAYAGLSTLTSIEGRPGQKRASQLELRTRSVLAIQAERLIPIIARDALDAADVWRTVAFTLFDRLAALQSRSSSSRSLLVDVLAKKGFLKSFVSSVREMDAALMDVLQPDPSSLNALYVYEAQMAFFSRLAQSRKGAERLVDARLFDTLAQVDFLQARPRQQLAYSHGDEYANMDSFLPAITSRYESLLLPSIRLVVSVLFNSIRTSSSVAGSVLSAFVGSRTAQAQSSGVSVLRQALSFVQAHRNPLLTSLRDATQDIVAISVIEQAQLIINMLVFILPILDDDALSPPKPLAQFHQAALNLSATYLYSAHWKGKVVPFTESEREEAARLVDNDFVEEAGQHQGDDYPTSLFDVRVRTSVQRLDSALLAYLERASEYAGVDGSGSKRVRPCLTSSLYTHPSAGPAIGLTDDMGDLTAATAGPARYALRVGRNPNVASLGTGLAALDEHVSGAEETLVALDKIAGMLENTESVRLEEWDDVIASYGPATEVDTGKSAPNRRKAIALQLLKHQRSLQRSQLRYHLNCLEILLVLLYRHFAYYIGLGRVTARSKLDAVGDKAMLNIHGAGVARDELSSFSAAETAALIRDGGKITAKVLEKLDGTVSLIDSAHGIANVEERRAYITMTARRLQSVLLENAEDDV